MKCVTRKKLTGILFVLAMAVILLIPAKANAEGNPQQGDGTKGNPYIISTVDDLSLIDQRNEYVYAQLAKDIDLSASEKEETDGYCNISAFKGELDGKGHTIKGVREYFIWKNYGGVLKNFTWNMQNPGGMVLWQFGETTYQDITAVGDVKYTSNYNNHSPFVCYSQESVTMERVTLDMDLTSDTYNGLFVGYEPHENCTYVFKDCTVKGNYIMNNCGVLFGNGSRSGPWGLPHVIGIGPVDGFDQNSTIEVENLNLTGASITGIAAQPHLLCGINFGDGYSALEDSLKGKVSGYENLQSSTELTGYSYSVDAQGKAQIHVTAVDSKVSYFKVISEVYSNYFIGGAWGGTGKHAASEEIQISDGVTTYYSQLGKVEFYDGSNGDPGTTGVNGEIRTITVGDKTYLRLDEDTDAYFYSFDRNTAVHTETSRTSSVKVMAYDKNGRLLNILKEEGAVVTERPSVNVTNEAKAGEKLSALTLADGWGWVNPDKELLYGGQTAFVKKGDIIAAIQVEGKEVLPEEIKLSEKKIVLQAGNTKKLEAAILPENTTNKTVKWTSNAEETATVDDTGKVTAAGAGTATITAAVGEKSAACEVVVYEVKEPANPKIDPSKPSGTVQVGVNDTESLNTLQDTTSQFIADLVNGGTIPGDVMDAETAKAVKEAAFEGKDFAIKVDTKLLEQQGLDQTTLDKINELVGKSAKESGRQAYIFKYLDLSLIITADGNEIGNLYKTDRPIRYTVVLPKDMNTENKEFYVIRIHNGVAEKLSATLNGDGTLSFETDRFSTYALAYEDKGTVGKGDVVDTTAEGTPGVKHTGTVKTGDESNTVLYVILMAVALTCVIFAGNRRKKLSDRR